MNEAPPKRVCSVIAVNNDRTMEMESNHSMYFLVPLYNSQSGRNMTIIWLILVVFPPLEKYLFLNVPTLYFQIRENITKNQPIMVVFPLPSKIFLPYIYVRIWSKYVLFLAYFVRIPTTAIIFNIYLIFKLLYICQIVVEICNIFGNILAYFPYQ